MKTRTIEVYNCDYCNKFYQRKHAAIEHETVTCSQNPINKRACFGCQYLTSKNFEVFFDSYIGEQKERVTALYCAAKKIPVYPPKIERLKNWFEIENNSPMPITCELKKDIEDLFVSEYFNTEL